MLLHRPEGGKLEPLPDLPLGRRDAVALAIFANEIQDFLLSLGQVHSLSILLKENLLVSRIF
jgi:hypothetical protein